MRPAAGNDGGGVAVYLASPLGFTAYGARFAKELARAVSDAGFTALDPWATREGAKLARLITESADSDRLARANAAVGLRTSA